LASVVLHANGRIDILGYPAEVFPPTDFHTATLVGERIIIVETLDIRSSESQVRPLSWFLMFQPRRFGCETLGYPPGWIHSHDALLEEGGVSILIRRGKLDRGGEDTSLVENIDDWRLHLSDWRWSV